MAQLPASSRTLSPPNTALPLNFVLGELGGLIDDDIEDTSDVDLTTSLQRLAFYVPPLRDKGFLPNSGATVWSRRGSEALQLGLLGI